MKPLKSFPALLVSLVAGSIAMPADAEEKEEPALVTIAGSGIKNIGSPSCSAGHESQVLAFVLTFTDASSGPKEVEVLRWEQVSAKPCASAAVPGPQQPLVQGATLETEAGGNEAKTRGLPHKVLPVPAQNLPARNCWCHSQTFFWSGCYYTRWYDCNWQLCQTIRGTCFSIPTPDPPIDTTPDTPAIEVPDLNPNKATHKTSVDPGEFAGIVLRSDGEPLEAVDLDLYLGDARRGHMPAGQTRNEVWRSTITDGKGNFSLGRPPKGLFTVRAYAGVDVLAEIVVSVDEEWDSKTRSYKFTYEPGDRVRFRLRD